MPDLHACAFLRTHPRGASRVKRRGHLTKQFWRIDRVRSETGLCTRAIYDGMADGSFPKNFPISKQSRAWVSDEVEAWKVERLKAAGKVVAGKLTEGA